MAARIVAHTATPRARSRARGRRSRRSRGSARRPSSWPPASSASRAVTTRSTGRASTRSLSGSPPHPPGDEERHPRPARQRRPPRPPRAGALRRCALRPADRARHHRRAREGGRDPRPEFKTARFQEGVETIRDLKPGMQLEGVVTNVAASGPSWISASTRTGSSTSRRWPGGGLASPTEVVRIGEVVRVLVLSVDVPRKRIAPLRLDDLVEPGQQTRRTAEPRRCRGADRVRVWRPAGRWPTLSGARAPRRGASEARLTRAHVNAPCRLRRLTENMVSAS